jgi:hypothetical protein
MTNSKFPDSNDAPRFLRVDSPNGEVHHIEMWSEEALQANNTVYIWVANDLGKVSASRSCPTLFSFFQPPHPDAHKVSFTAPS